MALNAEELRKLVDRICNGCKDAEAELVNDITHLIESRVWHHFRRRVLPDVEAEDVVQKVWLALLRRAHSQGLKNASALKELLTWLVHDEVRELVRQAKAQKRGKHREPLESLSASREQGLVDPHPGPLRQVAEKDFLAYLVGQQSGKERAVLLHLFHGHTRIETRRSVGVSPRTITRIVAAARRIWEAANHP